jgi:release factor H-coupled RctB family protein
MNRSKAYAINKKNYPNPNALLKTEFSSIIVCENKKLIYEEAPMAYKNIENIVSDLEELGLVKIIA